MMKIRSIVLIDGMELIRRSLYDDGAWGVIMKYDIMNEKDILKIQRYFFCINIIEAYNSHPNDTLVFYFDQALPNTWEPLLNGWRRTFPVFTSNISYEGVCKLLKTECPEYDEIVADKCFNMTAGDVACLIMQYCEKERFYGLHKDLKASLRSKLKLAYENCFK